MCIREVANQNQVFQRGVYYNYTAGHTTQIVQTVSFKDNIKLFTSVIWVTEFLAMNNIGLECINLHMIGSWKVDHDIIGYYHFSPPPQPWLHQQKTKIIPEQYIQDIKENKVKFEVMSTLKNIVL